jgi:UTP-glucose-1-phosphate uridylyltransferase
MKPSLLVLAAGMGSRYGGLKQIDPVGPSRETIIDYSVYDALRACFGKIVFIIRRDIEKEFKESIGKKFERIIPVDYVYQEVNLITQNFKTFAQRKKPWGTGHAILCASKAIKEPFGVINGDDFYGTNSFQLLGKYLQSIKDLNSTTYVMVGFVLKNTLSEFGYVSRGICQIDQGSFLQQIVEYTRLKKENQKVKYENKSGEKQNFRGDEIVSMNMWGFTPGIFKHLQKQFDEFLQQSGSDINAEFFLPTVIDHLIYNKQVKVKVLLSPDRWYGMTYPEDKQEVMHAMQELIKQGVYPDALWKK